MKKLTSTIAVLAISIGLMPTTLAISSDTLSSVVYIENIDSSGEIYTGSGVFMSNDAVILTAAHVITDSATGTPSETINVCLVQDEFSIPSCEYAANVFAYDEFLDLALLEVIGRIDSTGSIVEDLSSIEAAQNLNLPYIDFADYLPRLGDDITILGFPTSTYVPTITLTNGSISSFVPLYEDINWYYTTDATVNPGNSGGPVFNEEEKVVGIVSAVTTKGLGGNYGIIISNDAVALWFLELVETGVLNSEFVSATFDNDYIDAVDNFDYDEAKIFNDVSFEHKNAEAIAYLKEKKIFEGYKGGENDGNFGPSDPLRRGELLKIVMEAKGIPLDAGTNCGFTDTSNHWAKEYICKAKDLRIIEGHTAANGTQYFDPNGPVRKSEALKMILETLEVRLIEPIEKPFNDVELGEWFDVYVNTAMIYQLLEETGDTYQPLKEMTRAKVAENIYRLLYLDEQTGSNLIRVPYIYATTELACVIAELDQFPDSQINFATEQANIAQYYGFNGISELDQLSEQYITNDTIIESIAVLLQEFCPYIPDANGNYGYIEQTSS